jgi:hypothetical protein
VTEWHTNGRGIPAANCQLSVKLAVSSFIRFLLLTPAILEKGPAIESFACFGVRVSRIPSVGLPLATSVSTSISPVPPVRTLSSYPVHFSVVSPVEVCYNYRKFIAKIHSSHGSRMVYIAGKN